MTHSLLVLYDMKRIAIEGEPSPEYKGVMENLYSGTPYDQTFSPGLDDQHWLLWYWDKYKKNFPGQKNVYPQLEGDEGMPTVGSVAELVKGVEIVETRRDGDKASIDFLYNGQEYTINTDANVMMMSTEDLAEDVWWGYVIPETKQAEGMAESLYDEFMQDPTDSTARRLLSEMGRYAYEHRMADPYYTDLIRKMERRLKFDVLPGGVKALPEVTVGDEERLAGIIRGFGSIRPGFIEYIRGSSREINALCARFCLKTSTSSYTYKMANQPDPSTWTDTKVNNENEFGNLPVSKDDPGRSVDSIMGQDLDRVVSNIERLKRTKKRRPPS